MTSSFACATAVSSELFRRAFRGHPAGVVVVTLDSGGGPVGFTASSLASLSSEPPLISFGINTASSSWPHLKVAHTVVIHFLAACHVPLARRFATSGIDRFAGTRWERLATGEPVLSEAPDRLRVSLVDRIPAGDSQLVVGRVEEVSLGAPTTAPLLYRDRAYHAFRSDPSSTTR
ncbi:flavin reductase family protein [Kribbella sp. NPDC055110]